MRDLEMSVGGMHCQSCEMLIELKVEELEGVERVTVSRSAGRVVVRHDDSKVSAQEITAAILEAGYTVIG